MSRTCQQVCAVDDAAPKRGARRWATALFKTPILVIAAVGFIALSPGNAVAAPVSCGDTITADTTLHTDLTGCPVAGLVIGADGITLDLNGHTITGSLSGDAGIDNSAGHDGVTIKNGAVRNFTNGVVLFEHATGNRVQRLTLVADNSTDADNGVLIFDSDHNQIEHNSISGSFNGIFLGNTTDSTVDRNRVSGTHNGVYLFHADRNVVKRNALSNLVESGIVVDGGSENVLERNTIVRTQSAALAIDGNDNVITANRSDHDGWGIDFKGDRNRVVANVVTSTLGCSPDDCGIGIETSGGTGNLIAANLVSGTKDQGIRLREFEADGGPPTIGNVIRGNIVRDAGSDGIVLQDKTSDITGHGTVKDNLVANNLVTGSGLDGINVNRPANTVSGNVALRNRVFGIEAVDGVIDGGGNLAFANGNPAQCINVAC